MTATPIITECLTLTEVTAEFLEASLAGDCEQAAQMIGLGVPPEWREEHWLIDLRLNDLREKRTWSPWMLRAISLRSTGAMIGAIGFHTPPNPDYLTDIAPGGIEIGYRLFPAYRNHGYAREAVAALIDWAQREHGVLRFVLSISPTNASSLKIAEHFDFTKVGSHIDEIDGEEWIFVREAPR